MTSREQSPHQQRRLARATALAILFELDQVGGEPRARAEEYTWNAVEEGELPERQRDFVLSLVDGVAEHVDDIDSIIEAYAPSKPLRELLAIDRSVLRLAIYELCFDNKTPLPVVINEAVELAKLYGGEHSGRFVNGVLGSVAEHLVKRMGKDTHD